MAACHGFAMPDSAPDKALARMSLHHTPVGDSRSTLSKADPRHWCSSSKQQAATWRLAAAVLLHKAFARDEPAFHAGR